MITTIEGNLLDAKETYIAHQCNCVTKKVSGYFAKAIFDKWPEANDNEKETWGVFGTVKIHKVDNQKYVLNMFTQHNPGGPKEDNDKDREVAFGQALLRMADFLTTHSKKHNVPYTIAFPYMIGCGLAGGNWDHYLTMLELFEKIVSLNGGKVVLYKLQK